MRTGPERAAPDRRQRDPGGPRGAADRPAGHRPPRPYRRERRYWWRLLAAGAAAEPEHVTD